SARSSGHGRATSASSSCTSFPTTSRRSACTSGLASSRRATGRGTTAERAATSTRSSWPTAWTKIRKKRKKCFRFPLDPTVPIRKSAACAERGSQVGRSSAGRPYAEAESQSAEWTKATPARRIHFGGMRILGPATEAEVVAEFLRGELESERWRDGLLALLDEDGADVAVVERPDVDD